MITRQKAPSLLHKNGFLGLALFLLLSLSMVDIGAIPETAAHDEIQSGTLLLHNDSGRSPAPVLHTDVHMEVTGLIARVRVEQRFSNPGKHWSEAIYVFPLPDDAAVDRLRMQVGERLIEGLIQEKAQARRTYSQARTEGRKASLVEQERPNMFTTSVANIGPGEEILIRIEYQQTVAYVDGDFRLRFPLVVGPRYIPGTPVEPLKEKIELSHAWARNTDQVADASRITPPVAAPEQAHVNPLNIRMDLAPGSETAWVRSSYHPVHIEQRETAGQEAPLLHIGLAQGKIPADRDFELVWRLAEGQAPRAAFFTEQTADATYALLMLLPPGREVLEKLNAPRELTLVIDTSGSMHGASIAQAQSAVHLALDGLRQGDRFNLIEFNSHTRPLHPAPVPATPAAIRLARRWVDRLEADGGTEMAGALNQALAGQAAAGHLGQVVFITDGAVGNEDALFQLIRRRLGDMRLFTVGIGSAPNSWFMRKAARFGRGSFTHIGKPREVAEKMGALLERLEYPALTDIALELDEPVPGELDLGGEALLPSIYPSPVPDLYPGEPMMVALRLDAPPAHIDVSGRFGQRPWQSRIDLSGASARPGIRVLWARRKIEHLMEARLAAREEPKKDQLKQEVVDVALAHHLVSRFTSLVAVDVNPTRPAEEPLMPEPVKTQMPHGWSHEKVFGMSRTATPAGLNLLMGLLLIVAAAVFGWRSQTGTPDRRS